MLNENGDKITHTIKIRKRLLEMLEDTMRKEGLENQMRT